MVGARPVYVPLKWMGEVGGFRLDLEGIESAITSRTRAIAIINPHNPTGAVFPPEDVERVMEVARSHELLVIVDEIYDNFLYEGARFRSFISFHDWRDHVLYGGGFSKTFSMTGWRIGYLVARSDVIKNLIKVAVNIWSCPPSISQVAALEALRGSWKPVKEMVKLFRKRRDLMYKELTKIPGFEVWKGLGAFYLFPRIKEILDATGMSTEEFSTNLLNETHVVVLPGTAFPDKAGEGFLRFSYSVSEEKIVEGVERIKDYVSHIMRR